MKIEKELMQNTCVNQISFLSCMFFSLVEKEKQSVEIWKKLMVAAGFKLTNDFWVRNKHLSH